MEFTNHTHSYKFVDWVDFKQLSNESISEHPKSVDFLIANPERINVEFLNYNPNPRVQLILLSKPFDICWTFHSSNKWSHEFIINFETAICEIQPDILNQGITKSVHQHSDGYKIVKFSYGNNPEKDREMKSIDFHKEIERASLIEHPDIIKFLKIHPELIDWEYLSSNEHPDAVELLESNLEKVSWDDLALNKCPRAIAIFAKNPEKIHIDLFSCNEHPDAIKLLRRYPDKIDWYLLSGNSCSDAIKLLKQNYNRIHWDLLIYNVSPEVPNILACNDIDFNMWGLINSRGDYERLSSIQHPAIIRRLRHEPSLISWDRMSMNPHNSAISLLKSQPDNICWYNLSSNPNPRAIKMLAANPEKIEWGRLSNNSNIAGTKDIFSPTNAAFIKFGDIEHIPDHFFEIDEELTRYRRGRFLLSFNIREH